VRRRIDQVLGQLPLLLPVVLIFGALLGAPWVASWADLHGLPGVLVAFLMLGSLAAFGLYVVISTLPSGRRRRALARAARAWGGRFTPRFRVPASLAAGVPSFRDPGVETGGEHLISGSRRLIVFDRWTQALSGYEPMRRSTCGAALIDANLPPILVEPFRAVRSVDEHGGLRQFSFESEAFDRRYRVWSEDPRAASASLDGRMLDWLLRIDGDWTFEAGGGWVMCAAPGLLDPDAIPELLSAVEGFKEHIPLAAVSLYPREGPSGHPRPFRRS
jgi:hypothetical protein